jgi:hypothetical protein
MLMNWQRESEARWKYQHGNGAAAAEPSGNRRSNAMTSRTIGYSRLAQQKQEVLQKDRRSVGRKNCRKEIVKKDNFFLYSSGRPLVLLSWPDTRKKSPAVMGKRGEETTRLMLNQNCGTLRNRRRRLLESQRYILK